MRSLLHRADAILRAQGDIVRGDRARQIVGGDVHFQQVKAAWVRLEREVRIPMNSAGDSGVMSATHSNRSRPAIPIDAGRGGASPWASQSVHGPGV
jgi:hypothetical protein